MKKQQLGRAFSILAQHEVKEYLMHEDIEMFHAPSECHQLVAQGVEKRYHEAYRHARAVSGLSRWKFKKVVNSGNKHCSWVDVAAGSIYEREYH